MINKIFNEDCIVTMQNLYFNGIKVDGIICSPPYNVATKRKDCYYDKILDKKLFISYSILFLYLEVTNSNERSNWSQTSGIFRKSSFS